MPTGEPPHKTKGSAPLYLPLGWCGKSTITVAVNVIMLDIVFVCIECIFSLVVE